MSPHHAATPCLEGGCYRLATVKGRCAECQLLHGGVRVGYDQRRGSPRERGYGRAWEKRRKAWLEIEPFCRTCGKPGNQVDHVIPHRMETWLFDLIGNLQTLCLQDHTSKTMRERSIPIGMMYPLDLPEAPHYRPTRLVCGPAPAHLELEVPYVIVYEDRPGGGWGGLEEQLHKKTDTLLVLAVPAPRTAERAFWSYVMDCEAELQLPVQHALEGHPTEWWADYMLDQRAEEAMAKRIG